MFLFFLFCFNSYYFFILFFQHLGRVWAVRCFITFYFHVEISIVDKSLCSSSVSWSFTRGSFWTLFTPRAEKRVVPTGLSIFILCQNYVTSEHYFFWEYLLEGLSLHPWNIWPNGWILTENCDNHLHKGKVHTVMAGHFTKVTPSSLPEQMTWKTNEITREWHQKLKKDPLFFFATLSNGWFKWETILQKRHQLYHHHQHPQSKEHPQKKSAPGTSSKAWGESIISSGRTRKTWMLLIPL